MDIRHVVIVDIYIRTHRSYAWVTAVCRSVFHDCYCQLAVFILQSPWSVCIPEGLHGGNGLEVFWLSSCCKTSAYRDVKVGSNPKTNLLVAKSEERC